MAMSLNRVELIGNLTADPQAKQTQGGSLLVTFSVATNRKFKDSSGEMRDESDFHNIVAWAKLAEICEKYLSKGNKVFVEGRLQTRTWDDDAGTKHYRTEIVANNIIILTPKNRDGAQDDRGYSNTRKTTNKPATRDPDEISGEDQSGSEVAIEDLPF